MMKRIPMKNKFFTKNKLVSILILLLLFTFTYTSLISYNVTKTSITSNIKTSILPLISDNILSDIQQELLEPINNSSLMANDEFLIDWVVSGEKNPDEIVRYLKRIIKKYEYFSAFFVSEKTSNYYYYDGILKQISPSDPHDVWYYKFRDSGQDYALDVDTDQATQDTLTIFINHRLEDNQGNFLGAVGIGIKLASVADTLASYHVQFGPEVYMIDSEGLIQVHADTTLVEKVNIKDLEGIGLQAEQILANKTGTNIHEFKSQNRDLVISSRYFSDFNWFLIVEEDQTNLMASARKTLFINFAIGLLVTLLVIFLVSKTVNLFHNRLESLATTDTLTGLDNRQKFEEKFARENILAKRYGNALTLLFLDVDNFKSINDEFGHAAGDQYLKDFSSVVLKNIREIDIAARWGGDEFLVLLHRPTDDQAVQVAERLRTAVEQIQVKGAKGKSGHTVSIGIASSINGTLTMAELIDQADQAMFQAKQAGKNQVHNFTSESR